MPKHKQGDTFHAIRDNAPWLTLNRPDALNSINDGLAAFAGKRKPLFTGR